MPNTSSDWVTVMGEWIVSLVAIVKEEEPWTRTVMLAAAPGKRALFSIDGVRIWVSMDADDPWTVRYGPAGADEEAHFEAASETLRRIIAGCETLDDALASGRVFVRAGLEDLLSMHCLVMNILADGPLSRRLHLLWNDFDQSWRPAEPEPPMPQPLGSRRAVYGRYLEYIPRSVLEARV